VDGCESCADEVSTINRSVPRITAFMDTIYARIDGSSIVGETRPLQSDPFTGQKWTSLGARSGGLGRFPGPDTLSGSLLRPQISTFGPRTTSGMEIAFLAVPATPKHRHHCVGDPSRACPDLLGQRRGS
jgi:hypothetical protein